MELRGEPGNLRKLSRAKERWYLRVQGKTIGPFPAEEIQRGLRCGEFLPDDKICSSLDPAWNQIKNHPAFQGIHEETWASTTSGLVAPPPPVLLRARVQPPLPVLPVEAAAEAETGKTAEFEKSPEVETAPETKPAADPEINKSLNAATKELETFLSTLKMDWPVSALQLPEPVATTPEVADPLAGIPARPSYEPVYFNRQEPPAAVKSASRVIQIQLKVPETLRGWLLLLGVLALLAFLAYRPAAVPPSAPAIDPLSVADRENKTRDLKDSHLPDPSSPSTLPSEAGDPIPPLKAPTRPQRE